MKHSFEIKFAEKYGIPEAVMLDNLGHWQLVNQANNKNLKDGHYWHYNSVKAYRVLFPYMSKDQIRRVLDKLEKLKVIKTGVYNNSPWNRTKWFTIIDKEIMQYYKLRFPNKENFDAFVKAEAEEEEGKRISDGKKHECAGLKEWEKLNDFKEKKQEDMGESQNLHSGKFKNRIGENPKSSITNITTNNNHTNNNHTDSVNLKKSTYTPEFLEWFNNYPKERDPTKARAFKWWCKKSRKEIKEIKAATEVYKKHVKRENYRNQYILAAANFIGRDDRFIDFIPDEDNTPEKKDPEVRRMDPEDYKTQEQKDKELEEWLALRDKVAARHKKTGKKI